MKFEKENKKAKLDKRKTKKNFLDIDNLKIFYEETETIKIYNSSDECYESKYFRGSNLSFASQID